MTLFASVSPADRPRYTAVAEKLPISRRYGILPPEWAGSEEPPRFKQELRFPDLVPPLGINCLHNPMCILKHVLNCEQSFSFFVFLSDPGARDSVVG
jgi:hypothetical protein